MSPVNRFAMVLLLALPVFCAAAEPPGEAGEQELQAAWERFCDRLKAAGPRVLSLDRGDPAVAAEGIQYLAMLAGMAIEREQFYEDPARPVVSRTLDTYKKIGLDAADNSYRMVRFEPGGQYVIRGTRGNADYLGFQVNRGEAAVANLNDAQMRFEPDGSFELYLGGPRRGANWLALPDGADGAYIREIFTDWSAPRGSPMWIERLDRLEPPPRPDAAEMAARLDRIAAHVEHNLALWEGYVSRLRAQALNTLPAPRGVTGQGGSADNLYAGGYFRLGPDEVLLIETAPVAARFWNVQLGNTWFQSLDYQFRQGSLNSRQAVPDPDGRYRVVVAHRDPGYANWLDTGGHAEGVVYYRWNQAAVQPGAPVVRLLKLDELSAAMPEGSARVSPEARAEVLRARYRGVAQRFAL